MSKIIFYISIIYLVSYKLILIKIPSFFFLAFEIGELLFQIFLTYFTGYVFYLFVDYFPKKREQKKVYQFVENKRINIISNVETLFTSLINEVKIVKTIRPTSSHDGARYILAKEIDEKKIVIDNLDMKAIQSICSVISPRSKSPVSEYPNLIQSLSWYEYLVKHTNVIKNMISDVFAVIPYLEPKHIVILTSLQESDLMKIINNSRVVNDDLDLSLINNALFEYYKLYKEIKNEW